VWEDEVLIGTGRLLRDYHDAVRSFVVPPAARWRTATGAPGPTEIVCHNDVGPSNLVFDGTRIVGLVDWDLAAPARPEWDLAHAAWMTVPLMSPGVARRHGIEVGIDEQAARLRALCAAYGLPRDVDLVAVVVERINARIAMITGARRREDPALARLAPFITAMRASVAHIRAHATVLRQCLRR
jgi:aminoglycoside phosphotransferase (APT) family kinase protein